MSDLLNINQEYRTWVETIKARYKQSQTKALLKANQEVIAFYWQLGKDIVEMHVEEQWGKKVLKNLSQDLQRDMPDVAGLSETSLGYMKRFYLLYSQIDIICPQTVGEINPQAVGELFSIPWGHQTPNMRSPYPGTGQASVGTRGSMASIFSRRACIAGQTLPE